jgi:hypothetical protein
MFPHALIPCFRPSISISTILNESPREMMLSIYQLRSKRKRKISSPPSSTIKLAKYDHPLLAGHATKTYSGSRPERRLTCHRQLTSGFVDIKHHPDDSCLRLATQTRVSCTRSLRTGGEAITRAGFIPPRTSAVCDGSHLIFLLRAYAISVPCCSTPLHSRDFLTAARSSQLRHSVRASHPFTLLLSTPSSQTGPPRTAEVLVLLLLSMRSRSSSVGVPQRRSRCLRSGPLKTPGSQDLGSPATMDEARQRLARDGRSRLLPTVLGYPARGRRSEGQCDRHYVWLGP